MMANVQNMLFLIGMALLFISGIATVLGKASIENNPEPPLIMEKVAEATYTPTAIPITTLTSEKKSRK